MPNLSQDQEWLDAVNTERRNDQLNKVSYETFEIIMDKLEKEWFDLVRTRLRGVAGILSHSPRPRIFPNQTWRSPPKTRHAPSAMMLKGRTAMLSSSVTGATLLCTKTVMECHTFQKGSGYAGNALFRRKCLWFVSGFPFPRAVFIVIYL